MADAGDGRAEFDLVIQSEQIHAGFGGIDQVGNREMGRNRNRNKGKKTKEEKGRGQNDLRLNSATRSTYSTGELRLSWPLSPGLEVIRTGRLTCWALAKPMPVRHLSYCAPMVTRTTTPAVRAGEMADEMADLGPSDIDVALLYDDTTYGVLVQLEDFGFCAKGEGGDFVSAGHLGPGGALPVNTHGGNLSQAHLDGMLHVVEGVRQLRGGAGHRQVDGAEAALVSGLGGAFAASTAAILGRDNR